MKIKVKLKEGIIQKKNLIKIMKDKCKSNNRKRRKEIFNI